jgi:hypothetical protein
MLKEKPVMCDVFFWKKITFTRLFPMVEISSLPKK